MCAEPMCYYNGLIRRILIKNVPFTDPIPSALTSFKQIDFKTETWKWQKIKKVNCSFSKVGEQTWLSLICSCGSMVNSFQNDENARLMFLESHCLGELGRYFHFHLCHKLWWFYSPHRNGVVCFYKMIRYKYFDYFHFEQLSKVWYKHSNFIKTKWNGLCTDASHALFACMNSTAKTCQCLLC